MPALRVTLAFSANWSDTESLALRYTVEALELLRYAGEITDDLWSGV